jgi:hypothetical protein
MTTENTSTDTAAAKWADAFTRLEQAEAVYQEVKAASEPLYRLQDAFEARHGLVCPGNGRDGTPRYFETRKALLAEHPHYAVPDAVSDNLEKLCEAVCDIETELMMLPAPDLAALKWKLRHTENACWEDHYVAQMKVDIETLMVAA